MYIGYKRGYLLLRFQCIPVNGLEPRMPSQFLVTLPIWLAAITLGRIPLEEL